MNRRFQFSLRAVYSWLAAWLIIAAAAACIAAIIYPFARVLWFQPFGPVGPG